MRVMLATLLLIVPRLAYADAQSTVRSREAQRLAEGEYLMKVADAPAQPAFQDKHGHYFDIGYRYKIFALNDDFFWGYDEHWCGYLDATRYIDLSHDDLEELATEANFTLPSAPGVDAWFVTLGKMVLVGWVVYHAARWIYRRGQRQPSKTSRRWGQQERNDLLEETKSFVNTPSLFTVACLAKFAKIDGVVTKNEISSLEAVFEYLGITGSHREEGIAAFKHAKDGKATLRSYVEFYRENCGDTPQRLRMLVFLMFLVAHADGTPSQQTQQALAAVCTQLGFDYNQFAHEYKHANNASQHQQGENATDGQKHGASPSTATLLEAAYAILGCAPTDALNVVKTRYRKLVKDFHPDTVMSKGLPAEFVKFAEDRFKQIQAAYETVMQARGANRA